MVSATQQSSRIRRRKQSTNGKWGKRARRRLSTPVFPVHPEGYDKSAADAKKEGLAMANHSSAEKRNRQRVARTERNRAVKSTLRTQVKKARAAIADAPKDAKAAVVSAVSALDKAASKGAVHPKAASRKKARLARALHKATVAAKLALGLPAAPAGLREPDVLPAPPRRRGWKANRAVEVAGRVCAL